MTDIAVVPTPSLGDNSYLVISGDEAAIVDPQRDAWRLLVPCAERGVTVRYVLETHVHNDYVSGAPEVRAATGARIAAPARAGLEFDHLPMAEGDEIVVGDTTIRALETPGHTPEHTAYLVLDQSRVAPRAVFTGGSLIFGGAGRTDLLGEAAAESLARAQYRSLCRLALLADDTRVLPTHGAGSFCATTAAPLASSTIGEQRRVNPALSAPDEQTFVTGRLSGRPRYPAYYRHMAPINRAGAPVLGVMPTPRPLSARAVARHVAAGGVVVDARDRRSFAAAHIAGSLNIELDDAFASYVGWVAPFGAPLALVLPGPASEAAAEAITQLLRIGYDTVTGHLAGGIEAWRAAGLPVRSYPVADAADLGGEARVLDVRQPGELAGGRIPDSLHMFVGDLPGRLDDIPRDREIWTICASGRRAALAASLLDGAGVRVTAVTTGGVADRLRSITA